MSYSIGNDEGDGKPEDPEDPEDEAESEGAAKVGRVAARTMKTAEARDHINEQWGHPVDTDGEGDGRMGTVSFSRDRSSMVGSTRRSEAFSSATVL